MCSRAGADSAPCEHFRLALALCGFCAQAPKVHVLPMVATKGGRGGKGRVIACPIYKRMCIATAHDLSALARAGRERSSPGNPHTLQSSGAVGNPSRLSVLCLNSAVARLQAGQHLRQRIALAQFSGGGTPLFDALSPRVALAATCASVFLWRRTQY